MPSRKKQFDVPKLPPHRPEARDEGRRLIPLDGEVEHPAESRLNHYVQLANRALGLSEHYYPVSHPPRKKKR